jgi:hypothetical protein
MNRIEAAFNGVDMSDITHLGWTRQRGADGL